MLTQIALENFKSFKQAELPLGPFTVLVGTNASGKSNIRDAFRFLHGIFRDYTLTEILGEKWGEGGELQWKGIRGGIKETVYMGEHRISLATNFNYIKTINNGCNEHSKQSALIKSNGNHSISVDFEDGTPRIFNEQFSLQDNSNHAFHSERDLNIPHLNQVKIGDRGPYVNSNTKSIFTNYLLMLSHLSLVDYDSIILNFVSMRFLDFNPEAMKIPSLPGQTILGDRGENLSSVLYAIWNDENKRDTLLQWMRELTPLDVTELTFPSDPAGRVLVALKENGHEISAYSASDGTLRFLALIAALLGPEPARFYFIEELENGIHPSRLHLLIQLIEQTVAEGNIQIVATTHSPQLLSLLNERSRQDAMLVYRLPEQKDSRIKRIMDIPNVRELLNSQNLSQLHSSGWFEDVMFFLQGKENPE